MGDTNQSISEQIKKEAVKHDKLQRLIKLVQELVYYSQIHTVTGVTAAGFQTHEESWKEAQQWLWNNCQISEGEYILPPLSGASFRESLAGKEGMKPLLDLLIEHGGSIESTGKLDLMNIQQAQAGGRFWADENGFGFVWMPGGFSDGPFPTTVEEVELFEKWFPLKIELPEKLKNLDWLHNKKSEMDLNSEIKRAQINAGENVVINRLKEKGLIPSESPMKSEERRWSDADVKKFLEDYRVANMDCYLNPVIWFDKLNDEK